MELSKVIDVLDEEFDVGNTKEDWSFMFDPLFLKKSVVSFRTPKKNVGLMIKSSNEVNKIYTACFPSRYVLEAIRMKGIFNCLLIVKHPFDWDGRRNGKGFIHFDEIDYRLMEGMGISIYSLHTPLDKNRNDKVVSTAYSFAKVLKLKVESEFCSDRENPKFTIGLIGRVPEGKVDVLAKRLSSVLDYKVKVRKVDYAIGRVAVVTGGGFEADIMQEAKDAGASTFITGIITPNASEYCKKNYAKTLSYSNKVGLNVIGCSHYLTEKWVMESLVSYLSGVCKAEFIEDKEARNLVE